MTNKKLTTIKENNYKSYAVNKLTLKKFMLYLVIYYLSHPLQVV